LKQRKKERKKESKESTEGENLNMQYRKWQNK
jgi:hypothetical protein